MKILTKPILFFVFAALLPLQAFAQAAQIESDLETALPKEEPAVPYGPRPAAEVALDGLLFIARPVVIFADSPNDPEFQRQMELISRNLAALELRDVALITDTDPAAASEWRKRLRPRGFSLVLMDKDLRPVLRKPMPWDVREITAAIDKFPLRRQEMLERNPSGRR